MPSYQDALAAQPTEFITYASEMTAAASDLAAQQTEYGQNVAGINQHWRDTANDAFNGEVGTVTAHLGQVVGEITTTAGSLAAAGSQMLTECTLLRAADTALKAVGFDIQPAPLVTLGAAQRAAIAAAGPFGGIIEAALQAQALAGTLGLQTLTTLVNAADATAGAALTAAADLLKPLEDRTSGGDDHSMNEMAEDHSGTGGDGSSGGGGEESEEEQTDEEEQEEEQQPGQEDQAGEPGAEQPASPETPSGMEDFAQPETPDLENPWDASELDPEDYSGGLAAGAGLGGGPGGGLGGGLSTGAAGVSAGSSVPVGATGAPGGVPAAAASGAGGAGGMMGGGRGGGGGRPEDENARESTLIEDPDEDVWGIGKAADDLYE
ncbi:hypothetical protein [Glycomyces sp. MUSA5-2]|uniref:hypothetical protein n=1 Tax=Glycomyces sp. MUSA5-2 TaxID=2053002 RepID=UPI00300BAE25